MTEKIIAINNKEALNMPLAETYVYQEELDKQNVAYIMKKYNDGIIDEEMRDHLVEMYSDTMSKHNAMYSALLKIHGKSQGVKTIDPKTGKRKRLLHSNGEYIRESDRLCTPFTSVEYDFLNSHNNYTYIQFPGLKLVERAVEKGKIGGKYYQAYEKDCNDLKKKYFKKYEAEIEDVFSDLLTNNKNFFNDVIYILDKKETTEERLSGLFNHLDTCKDETLKTEVYSRIDGILKKDRDYQKEFKKIKRPHQRMNDIHRCSKSEICFEDIAATENLIKKSGIKILSVDNKHVNNSPIDDLYKKENYKGYRDYKLICEAEKDGIKAVFEMQIKLLPYAKREKETHAIYEELRILEENKKEKEQVELRRIEAEILEKKEQIEAIYEQCILDNNARIIDMASRMEVRDLREKWKNKLSHKISNTRKIKELTEKREKERDRLDSNKNQVIKDEDGFWKKIDDKIVGENYKSKKVADFLVRNILVSPKKPLNVKDIFNAVVFLSNKRKAEKGINENKFDENRHEIVKDDFRISRGGKGIMSFIVRYYDEIRNPYIPELRKFTKKELENYDKEMNISNRMFEARKEKDVCWEMEEKEFLAFVSQQGLLEEKKKGANLWRQLSLKKER